MPSTTTTPHHPLPASERGQGERSAPLRQRAFTLYCEGHRSPAIAARLGIPERTIRAWLQADLRQLAEQATSTHRELLQLAITRQLAIATAAWDAYHATSHHEPSSTPPVGERRGERYLRLAHAAYREIDRLQGLYLPAPAEPQQVRIILERIPNDDAPTSAPTDDTLAYSAPLAEERPGEGIPDSPAETATPPAPHHDLCSSLHRGGERPGEGCSDSPAETATATPPPPRVGEGAGGDVAPHANVEAGGAVGGLWPGYGPNDPLPPHIADAIGLPRFRQRNHRPARPVPPLFAYRL